MREIALEVYRGVELLYGTIRAWSGDDFMVETSEGIFKARLAAGCLLQPEVGDRVLLAHLSGESYILAVLVKKNSTESCMRLGEAHFVSRERTLAIEAGGLDLLIPGKTRLETVSLETKAVEGKFFLGKALFSASKVLSRIHKLDLVTEAFNLFARRLVQRLRDCYAWIEGLEQKKIGRLRYLVKEGLLFRARRSILKAEDKVTINGKKISLG